MSNTTPSPLHLYAAEAQFRDGLTPFHLKQGMLTLNSRSLIFTDKSGVKLFEVPLHILLRISIYNRVSVMKIKTRGATRVVYLGPVRRWMYVLFILGLIAGIVPGLLIYTILIAPNHRLGLKPLKKWQSEFSKHAIRTVS